MTSCLSSLECHRILVLLHLSCIRVTGFVGGSGFNDPGSSSKTLCLPSDPIFLPVDPIDAGNGYIYGAEYQYNGLTGQKLFDQDVPCSVCRAHSGANILMVLARDQCYNGWNELYTGLLVGNFHASKGSADFLCMDKHPQNVLGGSANQDGHVLHLQKTSCGSLKCPPYEHHRVVTCAVCSQ